MQMGIHEMTMIILMLLLGSGCGRSSSSRSSGDGSASFSGDVLVGTQCPFGTLSKPISGGFTLKSCKPETSELKLVTPPGPILISGDCAEKTLAVRSMDGSVDTLWQVLPDGAFSLTIPGFRGRLAEDGLGHLNCMTFMTMEIEGQMDCALRDTFAIRVDVMRLWMTPPSESELTIEDAASCVLPPSCHLETRLDLRQCG
jgi:hypothetical protein